MKKAKKKVFHEFITRKGLKSTRQRDIILDVFLSSERHMSIEELYLKLRAKHPSIGYATVYRTLKLFAEAGIANEIHFGDGQTRYEHVTEGEHHDHLVCTHQIFSSVAETMLISGTSRRPRTAPACASR